MTPEFEEALGLWEGGELSRDELTRRFPDQDIAGVLDAFDRVSAAAVGPTPDAGAAWEVVRAKLPTRLADRRPGRGKAIRLLAAAMIAVLVLGATAYAVVPSVRKVMNDAAGVITGSPDRSPGLTRPGGSTESGTDGSTSEGPGGDAATTDSDDDADGEDEAEVDANAPNSDADSNDDAIEDGSGTEDASGPDGGSIDNGSGSGEDPAGDAVDGDGSGSGTEDPG